MNSLEKHHRERSTMGFLGIKKLIAWIARRRTKRLSEASYETYMEEK